MKLQTLGMELIERVQKWFSPKKDKIVREYFQGESSGETSKSSPRRNRRLRVVHSRSSRMPSKHSAKPGMKVSSSASSSHSSSSSKKAKKAKS